jgi:hypothetical protein
VSSLFQRPHHYSCEVSTRDGPPDVIRSTTRLGPPLLAPGSVRIIQIMQAATQSSGMSKVRYNFRRSTTLVMYFVRGTSVHSRVGAPHIEGQIARVSKPAPQHWSARDTCNSDIINDALVECLADRIVRIRVCIGGQGDRVRGKGTPGTRQGSAKRRSARFL